MVGVTPLAAFVFVALTSPQHAYDAARQIAPSAHHGTFSPPSSPALMAASSALFGVDVTPDNLLNIDTGTAIGSVVGPVGGPILAGLAWDAASGLLFATDTGALNLVTVDSTTGATTIIGSTGLQLMHGLAIEPTSGTLYVASDDLSVSTTILYRLNKTTGAPTLVGSIGFPHIGALDFDPTTGVLYGAYAWSDATGYLVTIDTTTGQGTLVASTHRINGLAFDPFGALYASHNSFSSSGPSELLSVDKGTGAWTILGNIVAGNVLGLSFSGCTGVASYCTAGTTSSGCTALCSGAGTPSASTGSGFTIAVSSVEGQRSGLIFYGLSGPNAVAWSSTSVLCVKPPVQRTTIQVSGGTVGACDGSFALDWNAYIASNPAALGNPYAGGEIVWAQGWFRDPPSTKTTELSDGLTFCVSP